MIDFGASVQAALECIGGFSVVVLLADDLSVGFGAKLSRKAAGEQADTAFVVHKRLVFGALCAVFRHNAAVCIENFCHRHHLCWEYGYSIQHKQSNKKDDL